MSDRQPLVATRGLLEALLGLAIEADPRPVTAALATTPAGDVVGAEDLDPETPVFTHFYLPDAGRSTAAVFGVDLSVPPRRAQGRFVSHPQGGLRLTERDTFHAVVLVAVPPWDDASIAAFDRRGNRLALSVRDLEPPEESPPW